MSAPGLDQRHAARVCALLFAGSAVLALACIAGGYVLFEHDRLSDGWFLMRRLKWWLLGAVMGGALFGPFNARYHRVWLWKAPSDSDRAVAGTALVGVVRCFLQFPLQGTLVLFYAMWALVKGPSLWLGRKLRLVDGAAPEPPAFRDVVTQAAPFWVLLGPMGALGMTDEDTGEKLVLPPPEKIAPHLGRWFLAACLCLAFLTQMVEEESGDALDPRVLLLLGTYWLGDHLSLWFLASRPVRV